MRCQKAVVSYSAVMANVTTRTDDNRRAQFDERINVQQFRAADRRFYRELMLNGSVAWTGKATVGYAIRRTFFLWPTIVEQLKKDNRWPPFPGLET